MFKKIKIGTNIIKAKIFNQRIPLSVSFSVTDRCNLRCSYCSLPERKTKELTTEQIVKLIDEFAQTGVQKLSFFGGEPLLRPDIDLLIKRAKEKNMFVSITTNGSFIENKISSVKSLDFVLLSMDGTQEVHNFTGKENVNKLFKIIQLLKKYKINFSTSTVLTNKTIEHIDNLFEISKSHKIKLAFQPYSNLVYLSLARTKSDDLAPPLDYFKKAIRKIIEEKKKGTLIVSSFPYLNLIKDGTNPEVNKCLAGKRYCYVDTNGDVYPCSPMTKRMPAINAVDMGFKNAFYKMSNFSCGEGCLFPCYLEYNFLCQLAWGSLLNIKKALKRND